MSPQKILQQYFGYDNFRDGQEQLIEEILNHRDVLGVMPTGAGKSICFQVPALMMEGITLIISPLISLMKDQVNALTQAGIPAAYLNSSLTERQMAIALQNARNGMYNLIYVAPERLLAPDFLEFAQSAKIAMLTVDEAHCISQWGQDFRPSYAKIPEFLEELGYRPVISAFTATATPKVREDIAALLKLENPTILVTGFDRTNLYFEVQKPKKKYDALLHFLGERRDRSGIIYCSTRSNVEKVCEKLNADGFQASRYHAGLSDRERQGNQDDFLYDRVQIMVATNAFGMGIDKSNVSFVVHFNMPKDLESYYQEAGRAGRDGGEADCLLLYSGQDVNTNLWLIENGRGTEYPDLETETMLKNRERARLREMTAYCTTADCLRSRILGYFGEQPPPPCGKCGNCNGDFNLVDVTIDAQKILSCVARMNERFGISMVIAVLRGNKSEKLTDLGFEKLSTFGICEKSAQALREIIQYLATNDYLVLTDGAYPILQLGIRAKSVLFGKEKVAMKQIKGREIVTKIARSSREPQSVRPLNHELFAALKELRSKLATEQNVPAYVVFTDSSLTDMCLKLPLSAEEFLAVSGVGQKKLERYGTVFLEKIAEYAGQTPSVEDMADAVPQEPDFSNFEYSEEPVNVTLIADQLNCGLLPAGYKKLIGQHINNWLVDIGFLKMVEVNGRNYKNPTTLGEQYGITSEWREIRGENVCVNIFGRQAQEFIVEHWRDIYQFEKK